MERRQPCSILNAGLSGKPRRPPYRKYTEYEGRLPTSGKECVQGISGSGRPGSGHRPSPIVAIAFWPAVVLGGNEATTGQILPSRARCPFTVGREYQSKTENVRKPRPSPRSHRSIAPTYGRVASAWLTRIRRASTQRRCRVFLHKRAANGARTHSISSVIPDTLYARLE
uniref:Uncharacterized protein n=1 Tax=Mycena chlorophos TaxID=658473 RepID=A0ABQ0LCS6_MYCCL|nr:predicted protein [Mycena chlorophos]